VSCNPAPYQSLAIPLQCYFSGSTSKRHATANPTLGHGELSICAAGSSLTDLGGARGLGSETGAMGELMGQLKRQ